METFWTSPRGPGARSTRCRRRRRPPSAAAPSRLGSGCRSTAGAFDGLRAKRRPRRRRRRWGWAHPTLCAVATAPTLVAPVPASATTSSDDRGRVDCVFRSLPPDRVSTSSRSTHRLFAGSDETTFGNSGNFGGGSGNFDDRVGGGVQMLVRGAPRLRAAYPSRFPRRRRRRPLRVRRETCTAIGPPRISPATSAGCARSAASRRPPPAWYRPRWYRARYRRVRAGRRRTAGRRTATSPRPSRCSRAAPTASIAFRGVRREGRNERRDRASGIRSELEFVFEPLARRRRVALG